MRLIVKGTDSATLLQNLLAGIKAGGGVTSAISNNMWKLALVTASQYANVWFRDSELSNQMKFSVSLEGNLDPGASGTEYVMFGVGFIIPGFSTTENGGPYLIGISRKYNGASYIADLCYLETNRNIAPTEIGFAVSDGAQTATKIYTVNYEISTFFNNAGSLISQIQAEFYIDGVLQVLSGYGSLIDFGFFSTSYGVPIPICPMAAHVTDVSPTGSIKIKRLISRAHKVATDGVVFDL